MPVGVKHEGRRKDKNPRFPFMSFAVWMCDYCDEPLDEGVVWYERGTFHLQCFDAVRKEDKTQEN